MLKVTWYFYDKLTDLITFLTKSVCAYGVFFACYVLMMYRSTLKCTLQSFPTWSLRRSIEVPHIIVIIAKNVTEITPMPMIKQPELNQAEVGTLGSEGQSRSNACFYKQNFIRIQPHAFIFGLSVTAFTL